MKLSSMQIKYLLEHGVVQNRVLVKEGEYFTEYIEEGAVGVKTQLKKEYVADSGIHYYNLRTKWQVGKNYAVQAKRGGKGLWYCQKCKDSIQNPYVDSKKGCNGKISPLRVVVKSIRKERFLDISEEDAKMEGYKNRAKFIEGFWEVNKKRWDVEIMNLITDNGWNPFVWVLEFEVLK